MSERIVIRSSDLKPGMRLQHKDGDVVTLDRRKRWEDDHHGLPYRPGWWLRDGVGGLSDSAIEDGDDWSFAPDVAAVSLLKPESERPS